MMKKLNILKVTKPEELWLEELDELELSYLEYMDNPNPKESTGNKKRSKTSTTTSTSKKPKKN